jgi:hypothetical protein
MCVFNLDEVVHRYPQPFQVQPYGFSPVCVIMWVLRWPDWAPRYEQLAQVQANGFSPVCEREWVARLPESAAR